MTNPNQIREVLLFVCSKLADETSLSSKLSVAVAQERSEEESSVGDVLALSFRYARFCSASLSLFACWVTLTAKAILDRLDISCKLPKENLHEMSIKFCFLVVRSKMTCICSLLKLSQKGKIKRGI